MRSLFASCGRPGSLEPQRGCIAECLAATDALAALLLPKVAARASCAKARVLVDLCTQARRSACVVTDAFHRAPPAARELQ